MCLLAICTFLSFILLLVCVHVFTVHDVYMGMYVEVRRYFFGAPSFLSPLEGLWNLNAGDQAHIACVLTHQVVSLAPFALLHSAHLLFTDWII